MTQRNFLVAVDLTDEADEVLTTAKQLASERQAKLTVVTVVRPMLAAYGNIGFGNFNSTTFNLEAEALKQARLKLVELAGEHEIESSDCVTLLGAPAYEIRRIAAEMEAEMVIIGTHSRHGLGLLLGSTATGVLHGASCDVLAVKIHDKTAQAA